MGMKQKTYLVIGYKTTYAEAQAAYADIWEHLLDDVFDPVAVITSGGTDTVIIGQIVASADEYSVEPIDINIIDIITVYSNLSDIGINVDPQLVKRYLFGVWR